MAIIPTVDQVARPQAHGYDGYVDNILVRLGVTPQTQMEIVTADAAPPRVDTSESGEDVRDETGQRYSRSNLSGGAGLDFLHSPNRPPDAAIRFWDSKHVDVFDTDRGEIYESRLMRQVLEAASTATIVSVCEIDGRVFYLTGSQVREVTATSPSIQTTLRATITGTGTWMVAMGNSLFTLSTDVERIEIPSFAVTVHDPMTATTFSKIWAAKSRILGVEDNVLYEAANPTPSILLTLPPGDTVTDVLDVGEVVLVFTTTGTVWSLSLNDSLALVPSGETPFVDEIPILAAEAFGVVGIVTAESTDAGGKVARFYTGRVNSGVLADQQLIYQVGNRDSTTDHTPHAMVASNDSIYAVIPEAGTLEAGTTELTMWRYYLPTGGYARAQSIDPGVTRTVGNVVEVDDRMWVAVEGEGLYREADTYEMDGYVIGPLADFYTSDQKQWIAADLTGGVMAAGTSLELYDTDDPDLINVPDSTAWRLVTRLYPGETNREIDSLSGRVARYHAAKIVYRSDSSRTLTPGLRSCSFRALPSPSRDTLMRIPINVSDQVESPGKRAIKVHGRGNAIEAALRELEGAQVMVELWRPALQIRGVIEKFEETIQTIPHRGSVGLVMYARIRGTKLADFKAYGATTSGASLGQDTLGLVTLGLGEPHT